MKTEFKMQSESWIINSKSCQKTRVETCWIQHTKLGEKIFLKSSQPTRAIYFQASF